MNALNSSEGRPASQVLRPSESVRPRRSLGRGQSGSLVLRRVLAAAEESRVDVAAFSSSI